MYNWKMVLGTIGLLVGLKVWNPYFIENISWSWFDFLHQQKEEVLVDNIVLVDIDEKSLEKHGQFPFPRNVYADVLWETDPTNTHIFTMVFSEPDRFGGDDEFAEALVNRLTILGSQPTTQKQTGQAPYVPTTTFGGGNISDSIWGYPGIATPIEMLQLNTYGVGITSATPSIMGTANFDNTIRSAPLLVSANEQIYPSIALEFLRAWTDQQSYQTRVVPELGVEWIRMGKSGLY